MGQGRIRRIGVDGTVNYTIQATETYDENDPADSPSSWGTTAQINAMDSAPNLPVSSLTQVSHLGVLVTFQRFPEFFRGMKVKVIPTYNDGEQPRLEMWTHDSVTNAWKKRRTINMASAFVGVPSGLVKIFDLDREPDLENVDQVWVTGAPLASLTDMNFLVIHAFGRCDVPITITDICDDEDPEGFDCLPPWEWPPEPGLPPIPDIPPGLPPFPDLCNPIDIETYRALLTEDLRTLFDDWLVDFQEAAPDYCDEPATPPLGPPDFPPIDLCDPDAVAAYKEVLTPDQLAYFEELLATLDLPALCPDGEVGEDQPDPEGTPPVSDCDYNVDKRFPGQPAEVCEECPEFLRVNGQTVRFYDRQVGVGGPSGATQLVRISRYFPNQTSALLVLFSGLTDGMVVAARVTAHEFGDGLGADFPLMDDTGFPVGPNGETIGEGDDTFIFDTPPTAIEPGYLNFTHDASLPGTVRFQFTPGGTLNAAGDFVGGYVISISIIVFAPVPANCFLPGVPNVGFRITAEDATS